MDPLADIESKIHEFFEANFASLRLEGGHSLGPQPRETARRHVLLYWRKLRPIAEKVTDTEVKLNLPEQRTPAGRRFGIEGIVDIVRENDRVVMYDIKTHNLKTIQGSLNEYERQLNVYAHIWQTLRSQRLDEMAVICTDFPFSVKQALENGTRAQLDQALADWNPIFQIPVDPAHVEETIRDLGRVVDAIEERKFEPAPVEVLRERRPGAKAIYAVHTCRNCDARFTCSSYRLYATGGRGDADDKFRDYYPEIGTDEEREDWVLAALSDDPPVDALDQLA
jgi:hypothetical protein